MHLSQCRRYILWAKSHTVLKRTMFSSSKTSQSDYYLSCCSLRLPRWPFVFNLLLFYPLLFNPLLFNPHMLWLAKPYSYHFSRKSRRTPSIDLSQNSLSYLKRSCHKLLQSQRINVSRNHHQLSVCVSNSRDGFLLRPSLAQKPLFLFKPEAESEKGEF